MMFNNCLIDAVNTLNNVVEYDMNNLDDVRAAIKEVENVRKEFEKIDKDNEFFGSLLSTFSMLFDMDVYKELDRLDEILHEQEEKLSKHSCECSCSSTSRCECDKSECECTCDECFDDDEIWLDENGCHFIYEYPVDEFDIYDTLYDDVEDEYVDSKKVIQVCKIVADYINDKYSYLDLADADDFAEYEHICNTLCEYSYYVLNK